MKNTIKYTFLSALFLGFAACDVDNTLPEIKGEAESTVALNAGSADFSKYVSIGASFTAGFTDGALFKASQQNSFPNILASKFAMIGGGAFEQPLMSDNVGGMLNSMTGEAAPGLEPRFYFNGSGPVRISATPSTILGVPATNAGSLNNMGVPGAKSFHLIAPNYGNPAGLATSPATANPYFVRMASSAGTSVMADIAAKQPTFFTLSEFGGNDVLGYALTGGDGTNPITAQGTFDFALDNVEQVLVATGAKGVVANLPYITSLAHFTTVPYAPLDPSNPDFGSQIPTLNTVYGALNQVFNALGETERIVQFSTTAANPVVIKDENLTDLSATIAQALGSNPAFVPFVQSLGLPAQAAPLVAQLMGMQYGQARPATENDLLVLPSSSIIGKVNEGAAANLITLSGGLLPAALAGQFSAEGVTLPLADKWVLTPEEQMEIKTATDAYNTSLEAMATRNNYAFVDFRAVLEQASTTGLEFGTYNMNTSLVTGGLVSLDGVHLTARGYALMANKMLEAIDLTYGSNFTEGTNGLAKAGDFPTNYSPTLQ